MKKGLLLAMGAVSFGVAGLASFAPVASAAGTANVTATVTETKSVNVSGDVTISVAPGSHADGSHTVTTVSNSGNHNLTVKMTPGADNAKTDNNLVGPDSRLIGAVADDNQVADGKDAWGFRVDEKAAYAAVPASDATAAAQVASVAGADTVVHYGVSTAAGKQSGNYTGNITYTY